MIDVNNFKITAKWDSSRLTAGQVYGMSQAYSGNMGSADALMLMIDILAMMSFDEVSQEYMDYKMTQEILMNTPLLLINDMVEQIKEQALDEGNMAVVRRMFLGDLGGE